MKRRQIEIKLVKDENVNQFYDTERMNNGGGYFQPCTEREIILPKRNKISIWKRYFNGLGLNAWLGKRGGVGVCLLGGKYANDGIDSKNPKLLKACLQAFFYYVKKSNR